MKRVTWIVLLCTLSACAPSRVATGPRNREIAERFFRGVYGCDLSVIEKLAAEDIVVSYPIFTELTGSPFIRGRDALERFDTRFCQRWKDPQITIDRIVAENDTVVLVWSYRARDTAAAPQPDAGGGPERSWGGITVYRVNPDGRIASEFGEESTPGPSARLAGAVP